MRLRLRLPPAYPYVMLAALSLLLSGTVLLLGSANTSTTARRLDAQARAQAATIAQLRQQQLAACGFARDLGSVPIPGKPRPGKLGVSLVTDSRAEWRGLHCPGTLPVPPGLAHWAAIYHLPAS